jgi:hypothetical protein
VFNVEIMVTGRTTNLNAPMTAKDQTSTPKGTSSNLIRLDEEDEEVIDI